MKVCTKCNVGKEEADYSIKVGDKRHSVCKVCQREYKRKHYYNNKQAHYDRNKITKAKVSRFIQDSKSNGCLLCDEKEPICLDFHHLVPSEKEFLVSRLASIGTMKQAVKEISKCVCLCSNCHRKVHAGILIL